MAMVWLIKKFNLFSQKFAIGPVTWEIAKVDQLSNGARWTKVPTADLYEVGVKELNGDNTYGLARRLTAEIVTPPFLAQGKALMTSKR